MYFIVDILIYVDVAVNKYNVTVNTYVGCNFGGVIT